MKRCKHEEGHRHDCDYVEWRDSLVPLAEAAANATVGAEPRHTPEEPHGNTYARWQRKWNFYFHAEMDRLVADPFVDRALRLAS